MNDSEMEHFEAAARLYCQKLGLDPDAKIPQPNGTLAGVVNLIPVWHGAAAELLDLSRKLVSLKEAAQAKLDASGEGSVKVLLA